MMSLLLWSKDNLLATFVACEAAQRPLEAEHLKQFHSKAYSVL